MEKWYNVTFKMDFLSAKKGDTALLPEKAINGSPNYKWTDDTTIFKEALRMRYKYPQLLDVILSEEHAFETKCEKCGGTKFYFTHSKTYEVLKGGFMDARYEYLRDIIGCCAKCGNEKIFTTVHIRTKWIGD